MSAHAAPSVTIDRDGFERALANVIDNALRHTPRGGTIDVTCGEDADDGFVRVIDDGPGIAPDLLPHLFEPTARAKNPRYTGGAGLGLTIASPPAPKPRRHDRRRKRTSTRRDPHAPPTARGLVTHRHPDTRPPAPWSATAAATDTRRPLRTRRSRPGRRSAALGAAIATRARRHSGGARGHGVPVFWQASRPRARHGWQR